MSSHCVFVHQRAHQRTAHPADRRPAPAIGRDQPFGERRRDAALHQSRRIVVQRWPAVRSRRTRCPHARFQVRTLGQDDPVVAPMFEDRRPSRRPTSRPRGSPSRNCPSHSPAAPGDRPAAPSRGRARPITSVNTPSHPCRLSTLWQMRCTAIASAASPTRLPRHRVAAHRRDQRVQFPGGGVEAWNALIAAVVRRHGGVEAFRRDAADGDCGAAHLPERAQTARMEGVSRW